MVPAGPAAIRSATTDGLVWTLDSAAKGVSDLKVGSILLASGRATGRVVAISDKGDSRVVTLAPVELTDIIRDGAINLKQALSPGSMRYQEVPDEPGALSKPAGNSAARVIEPGAARVITVAARPGRGGICACGPSAGELPPASEGSVEIPVGDYKITPGYKANELSLDIERDGSLKVGVHFAFAVSDLSVDGGVSIANGVIGGSRLRDQRHQGHGRELVRGRRGW